MQNVQEQEHVWQNEYHHENSASVYNKAVKSSHGHNLPNLSMHYQAIMAMALKISI